MKGDANVGATKKKGKGKEEKKKKAKGPKGTKKSSKGK